MSVITDENTVTVYLGFFKLFFYFIGDIFTQILTKECRTICCYVTIVFGPQRR